MRRARLPGRLRRSGKVQLSAEEVFGEAGAHNRLREPVGLPPLQVDPTIQAFAEQWAALKEAWNGCAYCGATGTTLQRDCVMPISRGGRYTVDNVVPACAACNASKCRIFESSF